MSAVVLCVLERVSGHTLAGVPGNDFDGLGHTWDDSVLETRVLAFGVLTDRHAVNSFINILETFNCFTWPHICIKL